MRVTDTEVINALLTCPTIKLASEKVGLSEQAVYKRLKRADFKEKLQAERNAHFQVISSKIEQSNFKALETLLSVLDDENCSIPTKIRASQILLDLSLKSREQVDILARIEQIEDTLNV